MEAFTPRATGLLPSDPWLKKWVVAARLPFLTASVMPVLATAAAAWRADGSLSLGLAGLALVGIALIHAGANLSNDYFDHRSGADGANRFSTPFSGGSRVIQEGVVSPRAIVTAAAVCTAAGAACGIWLWLHTPGHVLLVIGGVGIATSWFYTAPPLRLVHRGVGELATMMGFGVLPALGTEWVLRGRLTLEVSWVGLPAGLLVAAILLINEFPDREADAAAGKRTLVVRLGPRRAVAAYALVLAATYGAVGVGVLARWMPPLAGLVVVVLPLSWRILRVLRANYADVGGLLPGMSATILQQMLFLLILTAACLAALALPAWAR
ncbi:MAG TPA: prenyltransferase [Planctomycetota bacterium]|nr:prenyltransferase [Planctomycetota bacterium]